MGQPRQLNFLFSSARIIYKFSGALRPMRNWGSKTPDFRKFIYFSKSVVEQCKNWGFGLRWIIWRKRGRRRNSMWKRWRSFGLDLNTPSVLTIVFRASSPMIQWENQICVFLLLSFFFCFSQWFCWMAFTLCVFSFSVCVVLCWGIRIKLSIFDEWVSMFTANTLLNNGQRMLRQAWMIIFKSLISI